jgi:hypothetical protein
MSKYFMKDIVIGLHNLGRKNMKKVYIKGEIKPAGNAEWYGLTKQEWLAIFERQGNVCAICKQGDKRWVTDHEHVRGWKDMPPHERKKYVRGILCMFCNFRILRRGVTVEKLENAITYLKSYNSQKK